MAGTAEVLQPAPAAEQSALMVTTHSNPAAEPGNAPEVAGPRKRDWPAVEWLPVQISISLPIPRFRVRDLLALNPGQTVATDWPNGDDLPLSADQIQLAWVEMESVEQEMAVRITRLL